MSDKRVFSLVGAKTKPRRTPEEEVVFQDTLKELPTAENYVIMITDPDEPDGPMRMVHNLHPAVLNLLLDQIKLQLLDELAFGPGE